VSLITRDFQRDITALEVAARIDSLSQLGFVNYFGLSCFGTDRVRFDHIGVALLKRDWRLALEHFLSIDQSESSITLEAMNAFRKGFLLDCHNLLPESCLHLKASIDTYRRTGDPKAAVLRMPARIIRHVINAVGRQIWNLAADMRTRRFQTSIAPGDLVASDSAGTKSSHGLPSIGVQVVTRQNCHNFSAKDLVLPILGETAEYPENGIKQYYYSLVERLGLQLDKIFNPKDQILRLHGGYRRVYGFPQDVDWDMGAYYEDSPSPLITCDLSRIISNDAVPKGLNSDFGRRDVFPDPKSKIALRLRCTLTNDSAAEVLVRELLHSQLETFDEEAALTHIGASILM